MSSEKPVFEIPNDQPPTVLVLEDITVGDGAEASVGTMISAHYVGKSWSNGRQFDASWDRGEALTFPLGAGRVIQGWDQGIVGMKVGGRRKITIPPHLGYGPYGAGGVIGPNETLVFVVDLVAVN
ncbi:FKBP-type peptidyl-prolyl cis-trans isomerase [Tessaracoccus caeni]|uniref:FKBP-type peptidyl-prolyl cis-trans isomerase n=1 Tax=Tessaracoccus caeni TaxID=3031239 RepID=UPI0023DAF8D8|nr:FKBP-type peptidyl-prolyl cis-trans isomerase [Tessaracoccus caeni]MDF1487472.1 FKBP-type peptidyl-prolyl cis-trans isomerase [Tessaracoccus caeni]